MAKKQFSPDQRTVSPRHILAALIGLTVFFLLLTSVIGLGQKYFALRQRDKELKEQQAALTKKEQDLENTNAYLATPAGVEESLRERYDYIKPGEQMIVITPSPSQTPPPPQTGIAHWWNDLMEALGLRKSSQ
jgi:cell division protein FtsB